MGSAIDLTGQAFGNLTLLRRVPCPKHIKHKHAYFECLCVCGNIKIVSSRNLIGGHTRSCGCAERNFTRYEEIRKMIFINIYCKKSDSIKS